MRLATLQVTSGPVVVGVDGQSATERFIDLHAVDGSLPKSLAKLLALPGGFDRARSALERGRTAGRTIEGTLRAPIPVPPKVICIGVNYRDHAKEGNVPIPSEPIVFSKFATAVVGPGQSIVLPRVAHKVDYEAELVVVIGRRGKNISAGQALSHVAGYMNGNDVSARDWQLEKPGKQWLMGKSPDTFAPTGPYFVTADEIPNPGHLAIRLRLNGNTMQDSNTKEMIFPIEQLIEHVSKMVTLEPGDLIFTGTPPGVGMARTPPVFLKAGDLVEVEIAGLGTLGNPVRAE